MLFTETSKKPQCKSLRLAAENENADDNDEDYGTDLQPLMRHSLIYLIKVNKQLYSLICLQI